MLLVDAISQAPQYGWGGTRTIAVLAAATALLVGFLVIESRVKDPVVPLSIFRLRTLAGANVAGLLLGGSFYAFFFAGTLYMQEVLHYSAVQTGVAWLATSLTVIALAGLAQLLVTRVGPKVVMATGMTLIGTGVLWATQAPVHGHFAEPARSVRRTGRRGGVRVHSHLDRRPGGRRPASGRTRVRAAEHQPAAWRGDRHRDRLRRRRQSHQGDAPRRPPVPSALTGGFQHAFWVLGAIGLLAVPAIFALVR